MLDPERIYQHARSGDWSAGLSLVHQHQEDVERDEFVQRAVKTFEDAFFDQLSNPIRSPETAECLETWVLLHSGAFYRLADVHFEQAVRRLVEWHRSQDQMRAAKQVARFAPTLDVCTDILENPINDAKGKHETTTVNHLHQETIRLTVNVPVEETDHTVSLFKSLQEEAFFRAAREAFPMYTPYPNVAFSSLIDFEAIRGELSAAERTFFFKGIVDCVIFDQHEAYRPLYFFEIDSAHHDAPERKEKDRCKDRIMACAGHRLYRIRPTTADVGQREFAALLRDVLDPRPSAPLLVE